jgi:nucleoside-diphosphate-sugar epimerase
MNKIFVTGASGFIGQVVCKAFSDLKYSVCGSVRNKKNIISPLPNVTYVSVGDLALNPDWIDLLIGYDCVIHCAGIAEQKKIIHNDIYKQINIDVTKKLVEQCVISGVKKFIFISSISVLGNHSNNKCFTYSDKVNPSGAYAQSKYEAEKKLLEINTKTSLEVIIIRPPIVYGAGAKGNISRLIKLLKLNLPLPFGLIENKKSFISIDNLVDVIVCCVKHPNLKGKVFLVSDDEDISLKEFLRNIARELGYRILFFPFPIFLLKFIANFIGKSNEINKLIANLQLDINYTKDTLNWKPRLSVKDGIRNMLKDK